MDKLTAVSGILFLVADIFAIASLAHPEWIVSDVAGKKMLSVYHLPTLNLMFLP